MSRSTQAGTRAEILDAADTLFGERGFDGATTREIAEACGVNKALIHYHFAGKDDLFRAVLDRYYEKLDVALQAAVLSTGDMRERLWRIVDTYLDFLGNNGSFSRMVQREAAGGRHIDRIVARMVPIFARGVDLVRQGYPASRSGDLAAPQVLVSFYGMAVTYFTYSTVLESLLGQSPLSEQSIAERKRHLRRMLDLVIDALEADATGAPSRPGPRRRRARRDR